MEAVGCRRPRPPLILLIRVKWRIRLSPRSAIQRSGALFWFFLRVTAYLAAVNLSCSARDDLSANAAFKVRGRISLATSEKTKASPGDAPWRPRLKGAARWHNSQTPIQVVQQEIMHGNRQNKTSGARHEHSRRPQDQYGGA